MKEYIGNREFIEMLNGLKGGLPEMAVKLLPLSLSEETQQRLCKLEPKDVEMILNNVIDQINCGSVETIDSLTQKALIKKNSLPADPLKK